MYFESRVSPPACSPPYETCRRLYLSGQVINARHEALRVAKETSPSRPEDYLLCADISHSCLRISEYYATIKLGLKRFPHDRKLRIQWSRVLRNRNHTVEAIQCLRDLLSDSDEHERPQLTAMLSSVYARAGFRKKPLELFKSIENKEKSYWVWYEQASAAMNLRQWEQAIAYAGHCIHLAPSWLAPRALLMDAMLSQGNVEGAAGELQVIMSSKIQDASMIWLAAVFYYSCNQLETAGKYLLQLHKQWELSDYNSAIRQLLALIEWRKGNCENAQKWAQQTDRKFRDIFLKARPGLPDTSRVILPTPLVAQGHMMCVPVSVMMTAAAQGIHLDVNEIYKAAKGWGGTKLWRMVDDMEHRGFDAYFVKAEPGIIKKFLRAGIPLIADLPGVFEGHVEVISGFDESLGIFYIKDPMNWIPGHMPEETLENNYANNGGYVIALAAKSKGNLSIQKDNLSEAGEQLYRLSRACSMGDEPAARTAYKALQNNDIQHLMAITTGSGVICSPKQRNHFLEKIVKDPDFDPVLRLRSILSLAQTHDLEAMLKDVKEWKSFLGSYFSQLVMLISALRMNNWAKVVELSETLLHLVYGHELPWIYRALGMAEMGRPEEARGALENALDIAPHSLWARNMYSDLCRDYRPVSRQLNEIDQLIALAPDDHELKWIKCDILKNGADGLLYEKNVKDAIRLMPRDLSGYVLLATWYLFQSRQDLAKEILEEGRKYLGTAELPFWDFEENDTPEDTEEYEPNSIEALLEKVAEHCNAATEGQHPDQLEAVMEANRLAKEGKLAWYQVVTLLLYRFTTILDGFKANELKTKLREILPAKLPGPPLVGVSLFLEHLDALSMGRRSQLVLVEWTQSQLKQGGTVIPEELQFQLAVLKESLGRLNDAMTDYKQIIENNPNMSGAHFRIAEISTNKGNLETACKEYETILELEPAHYGSVSQLIEICRKTKQNEKFLHWSKYLCAIFPYNPDFLKDYIFMFQKEHDITKAQAELTKYRGYHNSESIALLKAYQFMFAGAFSGACQILESDELKESRLREVFALKMDCLNQLNKGGKAIETLEKALEIYPDDVDFIHHKAEYDNLYEWGKRKYVYRKKLYEGIWEMTFLEGYFNAVTEDWSIEAQQLVNGAPPEHKEQLQLLVAVSTPYWKNAPDARVFLEWCIETAPEVSFFHYRLATHLLEEGQFINAYKTIVSILKEDPDNLDYIMIAANSLKHTEPPKAIPFLQQAFHLTGDMDLIEQINNIHPPESIPLLQETFNLTGDLKLLEQIAGIHRKMNQVNQAMDAYRNILKIDTTYPPAILGLISLGAAPGEFMDTLFQLIAHPDVANYEKWHVYAVEAALAMKQTVPPTWIDKALQRFDNISIISGKEERLKLGLAMAQWFESKGNSEKANELFKKSGNWWARSRLSREWPGTKWIPES
ncbi:MAG: hypothetical protein GY757_03840 [bacterium]|nr:hypothetical protein [bacterium]